MNDTITVHVSVALPVGYESQNRTMATIPSKEKAIETAKREAAEAAAEVLLNEPERCVQVDDVTEN